MCFTVGSGWSHTTWSSSQTVMYVLVASEQLSHVKLLQFSCIPVQCFTFAYALYSCASGSELLTWDGCSNSQYLSTAVFRIAAAVLPTFCCAPSDHYLSNSFRCNSAAVLQKDRSTNHSAVDMMEISIGSSLSESLSERAEHHSLYGFFPSSLSRILKTMELKG